MSLSQPSISAIVAALRHERATLAAELAFWTPRARADPCSARAALQVRQRLRENSGALLELAADLAPWLKQHPEYVAITTTKESA